MASRNVMLLMGLLVAIVSSGDAIKCHSCDDCSSVGLFASASECTAATYPKGAEDFFNDVGLKEFANTLIGGLNKITGAVVRSCYKVVAKTGSEEVVYRGCSMASASPDPTCTTKGDHSTCVYVCDGDGCNSAQALHISTTIIMTCLLIAFSFFLA